MAFTNIASSRSNLMFPTMNLHTFWALWYRVYSRSLNLLLASSNLMLIYWAFTSLLPTIANMPHLIGLFLVTSMVYLSESSIKFHVLALKSRSIVLASVVGAGSCTFNFLGTTFSHVSSHLMMQKALWNASAYDRSPFSPLSFCLNTSNLNPCIHFNIFSSSESTNVLA